MLTSAARKDSDLLMGREEATFSVSHDPGFRAEPLLTSPPLTVICPGSISVPGTRETVSEFPDPGLTIRAALLCREPEEVSRVSDMFERGTEHLPPFFDQKLLNTNSWSVQFFFCATTDEPVSFPSTSPTRISSYFISPSKVQVSTSVRCLSVMLS